MLVFVLRNYVFICPCPGFVARLDALRTFLFPRERFDPYKLLLGLRSYVELVPVMLRFRSSISIRPTNVRRCLTVIWNHISATAALVRARPSTFLIWTRISTQSGATVRLPFSSKWVGTSAWPIFNERVWGGAGPCRTQDRWRPSPPQPEFLYRCSDKKTTLSLPPI